MPPNFHSYTVCQEPSVYDSESLCIEKPCGICGHQTDHLAYLSLLATVASKYQNDPYVLE